MARVLKQVTVARDGMHNGFTDLVYWQDCYWLSYRKGTAHASIDGEACVSVSVDRERFREAARVKVPGDNRDPKLIAVSDERLAMYFPTWIGGHEKRQLQQYVTFSNDGFTWEKPQRVYEPHWWLWRMTKNEGRFYSEAYTYLDHTPDQSKPFSVDFLVSDNLLHWEKLSTVQEVIGGESAMHFFADGEVWLLTRNSVYPGPAYLSISRPPYDSWESKQLNHTIHSPVILEHEGKLYVAGRRNALHDQLTFAFSSIRPGSRIEPSVGIWELTRESLEPVLYIPATGDCAYPGLIKDPAGRICLSYYSDHAYRMGVIPERYQQKLDGSEEWQRVSQNDVYFAEIELP